MIYPDLYIICIYNHIYICIYTTVCTRLNKHFIEGTFRLKLRCFSWKHCFNSRPKTGHTRREGSFRRADVVSRRFFYVGFTWLHVGTCVSQRFQNTSKILQEWMNYWVEFVFAKKCICIIYVISKFYPYLGDLETQMTPIFEGQHHQDMTFSNKNHGSFGFQVHIGMSHQKQIGTSFANCMHSPRCFTLARETR